MEEISGTLAVEDLAEKVVETDGAIEGLVSINSRFTARQAKEISPIGRRHI